MTDHPPQQPTSDESEELALLEAEIAQLSQTNQRLDRRLNPTRESRDQYQQTIRTTIEQRQELEKLLDAVAEEQEQEQETTESKSNRLHRIQTDGVKLRSFKRLHEEVEELNEAYNQTMKQLSQTTHDIEELLSTGRITQQATAAASDKPSQTKTSGMNSLSNLYADDLPSMSAESLSAFNVDRYEPTTNSNTSSINSKPSSHTSNMTSNTLSSSDSNSPFTLHHRTLHAQYLNLDDTWARTLNELFRALFGAGSPQADVASGLHASTLTQSQTEAQTRADLESVIQATPHGKQTLSRVRSTGGGTMTPARGKIGGGLVRQTSNGQPAMPQLEEEKEEQFHTPPPHGAQSINNSNINSGVNHTSNSNGLVTASSSLSSQLHAQYSSELTRLYESFPSSQDYWLLHNLLFLSVKSKITEQHAQMVREEGYHTMSRQQLNESLAEVGMQTGALTKQLSQMLNGSTEQVGSFAYLWNSLRSLQLLELLRADLSYAHTRQLDYLTAQQDIQASLLQQRSRHEILLGAWRIELSKIQELQEILTGLYKDLSQELENWKDRSDAYKHMESIHSSTANIQATDRLTVDSRASFVQRIMRLMENGRKVLLKATSSGEIDMTGRGGKVSLSQTPVTSFDGILNTAQHLALFQPRFAPIVQQAQQSRKERMATLAQQAKATRKLLFTDGGDIDEQSLARIQAQPFQQLYQTTHNAVDRVADGLNEVTQQYQLQRQALTTPSSLPPDAMVNGAPITPQDLATRSVWYEFIQAPELLEERINNLKKKLNTFM